MDSPVIQFTFAGLLLFLVGVSMFMNRKAAPKAIAVPPSYDQVQRLALSGKKIQAIKALRQLTSYGLKESKDIIDQVAAGASLTKLLGVSGDDVAPKEELP